MGGAVAVILIKERHVVEAFERALPGLEHQQAESAAPSDIATSDTRR